MAPVLRVLLDGEVHVLRDIREAAAEDLGLDYGARAETLPSGQARYLNRSGWAVSYLKHAKAIEAVSRGRYRITDAGRGLLARHPNGIVEADLEEIPGYSPVDSWTKTTTGIADTEASVSQASAELSPQERAEEAIGEMDAEVAEDLLTRLHDKDPAFFEQAVVDLLVAMGYGGADGRARVTQQSNDGGIDGIIDQDPLGLNRVYIQAKRYARDNSVGRPEVQGFVGALSGKANVGVFITTGRFSAGARDYASSVPTRIILIDGARLADLMIKYEVGVQTETVYKVHKVDEDFFED
jgi:restriction system protein